MSVGRRANDDQPCGHEPGAGTSRDVEVHRSLVYPASFDQAADLLTPPVDAAKIKPERFAPETHALEVTIPEQRNVVVHADRLE
jgi:hypothetical protein